MDTDRIELSMNLRLHKVKRTIEQISEKERRLVRGGCVTFFILKLV